MIESLHLAREFNAPELRKVALEYILAHLHTMEAAFAACSREERLEIAMEIIADLPTIKEYLVA